MVRILAITIVACALMLGMVLAGGREITNDGIFQMAVDYDSAGDTADGAQSYHDFVIPITGKMEDYNAQRFIVTIGAGYPALHGLGNTDSAVVSLKTSFAGYERTIATVNCAGIPCTAHFATAANDTLFYGNLYFTGRLLDTVSDTAFTANFPWRIEGVLRGE